MGCCVYAKPEMTGKLNIVFVIPSLQPGGAERVLSSMANFWATAGREITILTFAAPNSSPFFDLDASIKCRFLALSKESSNFVHALGNNVWRLLVLRKTLKTMRPDVVISFLTETNVLALIATRFARTKVIVAEHTDPYRCPLPRIWGALRRVTYRWANQIVVLTSEAKSYFDPGLQEKISVVPNPIMPPPRNDSGVPLPKREKSVLALGRLSNEKGYDVLLQAFSIVAPDMQSWTLKVVGDGPERSRLERLAADLGIGNLVDFRGLVQEPRPYYERAGIFVLSSRYEGFPMGLCEAMAFGCPVIATQYNTSVFDLIRPGENGLVVRCDDKQALSDALRLLADDPPLRTKLGDAAKDITAKYGIEQVMALWEDLIEADGDCGTALAKHG